MCRPLEFLLHLSLLAASVPAQAAYEAAWVEFPALKEFHGSPVRLSALLFKPDGPGPFPAIVLEMAGNARKLGAPVDIVTYPGAHHSFDRINSPVRYRPNVRNLSRPDRLGATVGEHPQAREDALRRTLEFFSKNLKD